MSALKRRWMLTAGSRAIVALAAVARRGRQRAATAPTATHDQGRRPVRLSGRIRLVRQPGPGGRRRGDVRSSPARSRRTRTSRVTAGRAARSTAIRSSSSGIGCSNDRADTAIKETKRLMEQLKADVMIGPLSGDESIAVANYAKQHPTKTFVDGSAGAQDTTLKVRAPNFFRFNGDGAQWNAGPRRPRLQQAGLEDRGSRRGRLQLRLDVGSRLHRRVLRASAARSRSGCSRR